MTEESQNQRDRFKRIFRQATDIPEPYEYQIDLALMPMSMSLLLNVPTGLGKTAAAILAWVWHRRFAANAVRENTPWRLVYCLPMRVPSEQTKESLSNNALTIRHTHKEKSRCRWTWIYSSNS